MLTTINGVNLAIPPQRCFECGKTRNECDNPRNTLNFHKRKDENDMAFRKLSEPKFETWTSLEFLLPNQDNAERGIPARMGDSVTLTFEGAWKPTEAFRQSMWRFRDEAGNVVCCSQYHALSELENVGPGEKVRLTYHGAKPTKTKGWYRTFTVEVDEAEPKKESAPQNTPEAAPAENGKAKASKK